jgi:hypothetical protein
MFTLAEVRRITADLDARLDQCDDGDSAFCATLDDKLRFCAQLCCEYREKVRAWAQAVFSGQVEFDRDVEQTLKDEGWRLHERAMRMLAHGQTVETQGPGYQPDGSSALRAALCDLTPLLRQWLTPSLAAGPGARNRVTLDAAQLAEVRQRIESLPPLPTDWQPTDPQQRKVLETLRRKKSR